MVTEIGKKYDQGKPRVSLIPPEVINELLRVDFERCGHAQFWVVDPNMRDVVSDINNGEYADALYDVLCLLSQGPYLGGLIDVARVLEFGCGKYGESNWQLVLDASRRYLDAAWRHLIEVEGKGVEKDPETGLPHLAHLGCCLTFLVWFKAADK